MKNIELMKNKYKSRRGDNIDKLIAFYIKEKRLKNNKTQKEISFVLDVAIQQIAKYENGINKICASKLYKLAKYYNVPLEYFFKELKMNYLEALFKDIDTGSKETNKIRRKSWPNGDYLKPDNHGGMTKVIKENDDWEIYCPNIEMLENDWEVYND